MTDQYAALRAAIDAGPKETWALSNAGRLHVAGNEWNPVKLIKAAIKAERARVIEEADMLFDSASPYLITEAEAARRIRALKGA